MNIDAYFIDPNTKEETFVGNYDVTTPEEKKTNDDLMHLLKDIGADIEYMKQQGHLKEV